MSTMSVLSYSGNPSGKEILKGLMEKIIEDYNTSVEDERAFVESIKQRIISMMLLEKPSRKLTRPTTTSKWRCTTKCRKI